MIDMIMFRDLFDCLVGDGYCNRGLPGLAATSYRPSFAMASTAAFLYRSAQEVYEHIDARFQLTNEQLVELTKTFLHEFKLGLESYGHDMAMMYAIRHFILSVSHINLDPHSSPVFRMAQRKGKRLFAKDVCSRLRNKTGHFWPWILVVLICA